MSSPGYCAPHRCEHCEELHLNFGRGEPWERLKALHIRLEQDWPSSWAEAAPDWVLPYSIRSTLKSKGPVGLNDLYRRALEQDACLMNVAVRQSAQYMFLDCTRNQCFNWAKNGCAFFAELTTSVSSRIGSKLKHLEEFQFVVAATVRWDGLVFGLPTFGIHFAYGIDIQPIVVFQTIASADDPAAKHITTRPINTQIGSTESLLQIERWLTTCQKEHQYCNMATVGFFPTRLIEIFENKGQRSLRLVSGREICELGYAALSYSWGGPQTFLATTENQKRLHLGFDYEDLPATLREAILVTEAFDLRYLWIDAVCILQNDDHPGARADKIHELGRMAGIYSNATITIAASHAQGVTEGFLMDRPPIGHESPASVFQFRYTRDKEETGSVIIVPAEPESSDCLDTRAWALQERMLSRRLVDFGSRQTTWVCQTRTLDRLVDGWKSTLTDNVERSFTLYPEFKDMHPNHDANAALHLWHRIAQTYSMRNISRPSDRLPAIAAVAEQFAPYLGHQYLAGLWQRHLAFDLLWSVQGDKLQRNESFDIAPSWSWVSMNQAIQYTSYKRYVDESTADIELPHVDDRFQILEANVDLRYPELKFGEVTEGFLEISARHRKALWLPADQYHVRKEIGTIYIHGNRVPLPAHFLVDSLDSAISGSSGQVDMNVHLIVVLAAPDHNFSMTEGYSTSLAQGAQAGAERTGRKFFSRHEKRPKQTIPLKRPFISIKGLVLREIDINKFTRLGVFEFDHHYSESWKTSSVTTKWNDRFRDFHRDTQWMMGGEVQKFMLI